MQIGVITLFPEMFTALTEYGITGRACRAGLFSLTCWNPRDFTTDRHRTVDDRPFGGGPGMLMKTEPLLAAIRAARAQLPDSTVIYLSPQGRKLDQAGVECLATRQNLIFLCGRYQGIDERVLLTEVDEEWSVGDYVLSGGELPAMIMIDALTRYLPGALGHEDSAEQDSFASGLLDSAHYTRPQEYEGEPVPQILLGGNHEAIRRWRLKDRLGRTWLKRPELLQNLTLDKEQDLLLKEFISEYRADRSRD
ncbi:MAG: tRNA (guanosine(37)-N1)-methyltransferase TrmD [Pseudomonadales bacterium]|nr:tRNA (guanosine(37)-N1)-methyltransferase TrmD [Pseudomonadales bacterium]